ncbi:hypothetical protein D9756_008998 [Leucocoprinus leucothites]|uniref:EXPERA domain-containing protein n=1 Tax=Leucocoprinus leucothites TaxID=201217 RepID=A0A8H5FUE6_9AGAR|nr:hypothetical protein D9756_008998 [Leucoagaricus leucothites]
MSVLHPYYPTNLTLPGYIPNSRSVTELIGAWLVALSIITVVTFAWLSPNNKLTLTERLITLWFVTCGFIHIVFEGHFIFNHNTLVSLTDFISQEWKEYAKSDSRYLHSDPFVLTIETITSCIWGPLCLFIAYATANRFPSCHVWTALMCFAHVYGDALYYATTIIQGCPDSRPEVLYFWVYFIGLNALWLIIPIALLTRSIITINAAMVRTDDDKGYKKNI